MLRYLKLIVALSLTMSGDILFSLALIWRVLSLDGSAKTLGLFLCLVTILTFVLQKFSGKFKKVLEKTPGRSFMWIRIIGVIFSLCFLPLLWKESMMMLYIAGMLSTVINFLSTITMEAMMAQEVLEGRLSSNKASRILQIATLASSFLGASMLGITLSLGNMKGVLFVNVITFLIGAIYFIFQSDVSKQIAIHPHVDIAVPNQQKIRQTNLPVLRLAFFGLTLLITQISAFNFLVPLIAQHEKMWTASQYGLIDAAAEFGGFLATFIMLEKGGLAKIWSLAFAGILCVDILFFAVSNAYIISMSALFLGFFVSTFRIKQREFIYDSVASTHEILDWTGRITAMTAIIKALAPMSLAFVAMYPSFDLMMIGIVVSIGMIITQVGFIYFKKQTIHKKHLMAA